METVIMLLICNLSVCICTLCYCVRSLSRKVRDLQDAIQQGKTSDNPLMTEFKQIKENEKETETYGK